MKESQQVYCEQAKTGPWLRVRQHDYVDRYLDRVSRHSEDGAKVRLKTLENTQTQNIKTL